MSDAPMVAVARLCGVLMGKGLLTLRECRQVLGPYAPTDAELLERRPPHLTAEEAMDAIAKAHGKNQ